MENILRRINNASLKFLCPLSLKETYEVVGKEIKKLAGAQESSIFLIQNDKLERVYASSPSFYKIKPKRRDYIYETFKTKKPRLVNVEEVKDMHSDIIKAKIKTIIYIPLFYQDKEIGVLTVYSLTKKSFTKEQFDAFKLFGSMATLAIIKAKHSAGMKTVLEERDVYMNLNFLEPLTTQHSYEIIVREAIKLVNANYCSLTLEKKGHLEEVFSTLPIKIKRRKRGQTFKSFKEARVFMINRVEKNGKFGINPRIYALGIKSVIFIPLSYKKKSIGVLIVHSKKMEYFTRKELRMLLLFGSLATLAIRKSQLYEETQKAVEVRDFFLSLASHEFRTPLTTLNGYIQMLSEKIGKTNSTESKWIQNVADEGFRLANLVKELLEI